MAPDACSISLAKGKAPANAVRVPAWNQITITADASKAGGKISTRQAGNRRENRVIAFLQDKHGYHCFPSRGSRGIDVVCLSTIEGLPHLGIEVGGASKSCKEAFGKMYLAPHPPGMYLLVVREVKRGSRNHLRWHAQPEVDGHDSFEDALAEARSL